MMYDGRIVEGDHDDAMARDDSDDLHLEIAILWEELMDYRKLPRVRTTRHR